MDGKIGDAKSVLYGSTLIKISYAKSTVAKPTNNLPI
jgi:hypothetical protein